MSTVWIALLRGINVGGHRRIAMADLRALAAMAGYERPRTHLQSGNLVFQADLDAEGAVEDGLTSAIAARLRLDVTVMARTQECWQALVSDNPFPEAATKPKTLHAFLFHRAVEADAAAGLSRLARADERYGIVGRTLYLHAPSGIGRSKFAASVERALGVPVTARNWSTVSALAELARDIGA